MYGLAVHVLLAIAKVVPFKRQHLTNLLVFDITRCLVNSLLAQACYIFHKKPKIYIYIKNNKEKLQRALD